MTPRALLAVVLIAGLAVSLRAGGQVFRGSATVVAVEVPVHVIRDGEPVRGLTRDDFVVLDEGEPREIVGFEVIDLTITAPEAADGDVRPPVSARRHFLLLFDLTFSRPDSVAAAREAATELMAGGLHPSDLVAVATYAHGAGPRLLLGFTSDRAQARAAIESLGLARLIEPLRDPLGLVFGDLDAAGRAFGLGQGAGEGRGPGGAGRREFAEAMADFARRAEAVGQRQELTRITALTRSFADLARLMDSVRGRKHVVYLSEGFDTSALFGTADVERIQRMAAAVEEGRVWEVDSEERYGDTRSQNQLEQMFDAFRRADCTIQAVDVGGIQRLAGVEAGSRRSAERQRTRLEARHDSLAVMASATGGELFRSFNDLSEAMREMLERTGVTYVLAFEPKGLELDGAFHRLKVKLKDGARARLVHRPGYFAPRPFGELSDGERRLATAELIVGGRDGGAIASAVLASPFPAAGDKAYVSVFAELDGESLAAATPGELFDADLYAYALDAHGRVRGFLGQSLSIDLAQVRSRLAGSGLKFYGHLDLAAGAYTLRVLVRERSSGAYALASAELRVPDFSAGEPALLPPFFVEAPGRWMMAREELAADEARPAFPFMAAGQPFLPAARPVLPRGAGATVHLMAYGLGARPEVSSRIVTALGAALSEPAVDFAPIGPASTEPAAGVPATLTARFGAGLLDPGAYTLEVTARDPATGREASSSGPFVVGER